MWAIATGFERPSPKSDDAPARGMPASRPPGDRSTSKPVRSRKTSDVSGSLDHRVHARRLPEPVCAELRLALERLEVDVDQPEAVAVTVHPLEVVLRAPVKVPVHRYALRARP